MTRQARLYQQGVHPHSMGMRGSKAGLVTVARVNQECRLPGKSVVRRQVQGQTAESSL